MKYFLFLFLFISQFGYSQKASVTPILNEIDFKQDTLKAVYEWVTDNIAYDVAELKRREENRKKKKKANTSTKGKTREEHQNDKLKSVIKKKKGVCEHYALLFDAMVSELGYTSKVVTGFSKGGDGKVNKKIGHAWNAVKHKGEWKLYDCTWGAGNVENEKKFIRKYNSEWYDTAPDKMRETHLPYDPIWQLSSNPINYKQFKNNQKGTYANQPYSFEEFITADLNANENEQLKNMIDRSNLNGSGIRLLNKWQKLNTKRIGKTDYRLILNECRDKSSFYDDYIKSRKKKYKDKKWTLAYCKEELPRIKDDFVLLKSKLEQLNVKDRKAKSSIKKSIKSSASLIEFLENEIIYINKL